MSTVQESFGPKPGPSGDGAVSLGTRIARNTTVLAASRFIARGMGMGVTIILARHLGAESYGIYQRAEALVLLFSVIANLGLDMILTRETARDPDRVSKHLTAVLVCKVVLAFATFALIHLVTEVRGDEGSFTWGVRLFSIILIVNALVQSMDAALQGLQAMRYVAAASLIGQTIWTVGAVLCVVGDRGFLWVIGALLVGAVVHLLVSLVLIQRKFAFHLELPGRERIGFFVREALPLAFAASFVILYQQVDAVMLGDMKGNAEVGWYKASAKIMLIFSILRESFMLAVFPALAALIKTDPSRISVVFTRTVRYQIILALLFIVGMICFSRMAFLIFGLEFRNTAQILPVIAWITIPQIISITSGRTLIAAGHQDRLIVTTGVSLLTNIIGNLVLIPKYSYLGAAYASVISETVVATLNLFYVHRLVCRPRLIQAVIKPVIAAALTLAAVYPIRAIDLVVGTPIAIAIYVILLFVLRTFSPGEIRQAREFVRDLINRIRGRSSSGGSREDVPDIERGDFEE